MRVLYDGVIYRIQKYGGVVRYFNSLIHNLSDTVHPILLAPNRPTVSPSHPNLSTFIETCESILWPIKPLRKRIIAQRSYNRIVAEAPDVIHPTYYYSSLRGLANKIDVPTVLTVYDLIHERFSAEMDPHGKQTRLKKSALDRADAVICISHSTKYDLQKYYNIPEERIRVIHLGCEFDPLPGPPQEHSGKPYFLYVGERNFYKNFERMIRAFAPVAEKNKDLQLRCVGGQPFTHEEQTLIADLNLQNLVSREGYLPDHQMKNVYSQAIAVVYPSLYEGFGFPILEGMTCGTAVLTSNRSSMPEVAGDAAILFDPYSIEEISAAMLTVVNSSSIRTQMIEKGLDQARQFSRQKMARETLEVYQSVAGQSEAAA
ncbi:MAG: glycosyltransferase family 1 protein [Planctomycetota bacterium]|nr:glycosyltransferase family 1 protein [Planctomycetota bacterium]